MSEELFVMDTRSDVGEGIIKKSYWLPSKGAISNWLASVITPETSFIIICD